MTTALTEDQATIKATAETTATASSETTTHPKLEIQDKAKNQALAKH